MVRNAIEKLNRLAGVVKSVCIVWIPAHKGHEGNERADDLAKEGTELEITSPGTTVGSPASEMKSEIRGAVYAKWTEEWHADKRFNHSKTFYGGPDKNKAKYVYKLARLELGRFIRIVTGHNNLNFFQHKIGLSGTDECRLCGDCLLYTSPSPRDRQKSRMPSSA